MRTYKKFEENMKKLSGLIAFIVILVLIYTGYWFYQSRQVKDLFTKHLKEYEQVDKDGYHLKVDDISVGGFPLNYEVKINNPRYESADASLASKSPRFAVDGSIKVGTDVLGKSYWIKQAGDLNYLFADHQTEELKSYVVQGNMEVKADVAHPQYWKAFLHPFFGFPKAFYQEDASFQDILNELTFVGYEDKNFVLSEVNGNDRKDLLKFSKAWLQWKHSPGSDGTEKIALNIDLKDFEAVENGKPVIPHLQKLVDVETMTVDIPYILGSGKNTISLNFEAALPRNFDFSKILDHKNLNIELKDLNINNLYGDTSIKFNVSFKEKDVNQRNLHFDLTTESKVTKEGSEAIHRHFIDTLKASAESGEKGPSQEVLVELLKCCQEKLESIIPDYTKLGQMRFIFDGDVLFKQVANNLVLDRVTIKNLDSTAEPYGIRSHGDALMVNDLPKGQYEIDIENYQTFIHDVTSYYNRIYPILEKFAEANKQPLHFDTVTSTEEKEIVDFLKSLTLDPESNKKDLTIVIDFKTPGSVKIGHNSFEQVKLAWDKLISDLSKPIPPAQPKAETPSVPEQKKAETSNP